MTHSKAKTALGVSIVALTISMIFGANFLFRFNHDAVVALTLIQGVIYAIIAWSIWVLRGQLTTVLDRKVLITFVATAIVLRLLLLFAPPHSTDIYRYIWDGRVQAHGINPYLYIPSDPALTHLRDDNAIYPHINRKEYAPTIYPPLAQVVFFFASRIAETITVMKLAMLAFEVLTVFSLVKLLASRGLPLSLSGLYLLHPLPIWEIAGSGHVDIVAVAFLMLALLAAEKGQQFNGGVALAAGMLAKYFPLVITPAIYRRWDWKMLVAFVATAAAIWLPYYAGAGLKVFGFLGGYADEQLGAGEGFLTVAILKQLGVGPLALPLFLTGTCVILFALAWRTGFRATSTKPDLRGAFLIATVFTAMLSPHYPWYFIWLIPFLCIFQSPAVIWLTISATALYRVGWPPNIAGACVLYVPFIVLFTLEQFKIIASKEAPDGHRYA